MNVIKKDDYNEKAVEKARNTVIELTKNSIPTKTVDLFFSTDLKEIEDGIRRLNDYSSKCWILSALALYTLVYDKELYKQSGLTWTEYYKHTKEKLGMDKRQCSEQLSGARFFIKHHDLLMEKGWDTTVPNQSLARGELAYELSGDIEKTVEHMINDTQLDFKNWYQSFKLLPETKADQHPEIVIEKSVIKINGIDAVTISDKLADDQRMRIEGFLEQIFTAIKQGDFPAIIPVSDEKEARHLFTLRDNYRNGR